MPPFRVGTVVLDLEPVGSGVRYGALPPAEERITWDLNLIEALDLEAFENAGWKFRPQQNLHWADIRAANAGPVQLGILVRHPWGGLVIVRDRLIVDTRDTHWVPSEPEFDDVRRAPLTDTVYDIGVPLSDSDFLDTLEERIASIHALHGGAIAEPLLVHHLVNPGRFARVSLDPIYQWHWDQIELEAAWKDGKSMGTQVKGNMLPVRVAVIDFGFYLNEPQLAGKKRWWAYVDETGNIDVNGTMPVTQAAHGTFCAGLISALLDTDGVNGAVPDAELILVAIQSVTTPQLALATALRLCAKGTNGRDGADIISASIGSNTTPMTFHTNLQGAVDDVQRTGRGGLGTSVIWADFDNNLLIRTGSLEDYRPILCVGQSDTKDEHTMCGYGPGLDLLAPGSGVWGVESSGNTSIPGSRYGASVAAPIVAGVAALVLAQCPDLTFAQVANTLTASCDPSPAQQGQPDDLHGWGRVNAYAAVHRASNC